MNKEDYANQIYKDRRMWIGRIRKRWFGDGYEDIFHTALERFLSYYEEDKDGDPLRWFGSLIHQVITREMILKKYSNQLAYSLKEILPDCTEENATIEIRDSLEKCLSLIHEHEGEERWEIFKAVVIDEKAVDEVAREFGKKNRNIIAQTHRVREMLKGEMEKIC